MGLKTKRTNFSQKSTKHKTVVHGMIYIQLIKVYSFYETSIVPSIQTEKLIPCIVTFEVTGACFSTLIFTAKYPVTKSVIYFHTTVLFPFVQYVQCSTNCCSVHRVQLQFTNLYLGTLLSNSSGKKVLFQHLRCDK